ncbi:MAG: hypothetical protein HRU03_05345 [Nanoarchaeales archaeon]|nr:hypothetical protein [Nanoarchaeales archaeon]
MTSDILNHATQQAIILEEPSQELTKEDFEKINEIAIKSFEKGDYLSLEESKKFLGL